MATIDDRIIQHARTLPTGTALADEAYKLARRLSSLSEWDDWVDNNITELIHERLRAVLRRERSLAYKGEGKRQFHDSMEATGTPLIEVKYSISRDTKAWKPLGDLNQAEVLYLADDRKRSVRSVLLEESYFRAIAKRIDGKIVREVFSNEQLVSLRNALEAKLAHA